MSFQAKPLKARVLRNETVKDILCSSVSVTMPTEPKDLTMEQEASVVMDDTSSLSLNTVNIASAIEGINHGCHGDMCSTEQATDNINIETITDSIDNNDIIKNDASQSPNMHRGSPAICSQGLPLGRVGQSESTDGQGNEAQVREEIDLQVLDSTVTTMKLESQKKPKNKKDVSRKKKGRRGRRKKNCMAEQVTIVPDSTGIQNGYSVVANSENVAINNSELQSSPEPSVSSTSNRADDGQMATSSNYQRPVINDDQKFVAVKKLKLENNLINSPSNLVTSTSNNIQHDISVSRLPPPDTVMVVGNSSVNDDPILPSTSVSQGISVSSKDTSEPQGIDDVIVPSKDTSELQGINDIIVPSKDTSEPQGIDDIIVPSKVTSKPRGINRRKHQKPKKMGMTDVMKTEKTTNLQNDGVGANDEVNCNGANISPLVPTSDTIEEIIQSQRKKNEFRVKEPFQASSITACLKFEREEATAVNAIPMAESRWVLFCKSHRVCLAVCEALCCHPTLTGFIRFI